MHPCDMIANSHAIYPPASLFHTVHIILQLAVCNPKNLQCVTQWSNKQNLNFNTPHTECKKKTHLPNPKVRSTLPKFFVGCFRAATSQLCTHCTLTSAHWSLTTSRFRAEPRTCREGWWHEKKRSLRCWRKKQRYSLCACVMIWLTFENFNVLHLCELEFVSFLSCKLLYFACSLTKSAVDFLQKSCSSWCNYLSATKVFEASQLFASNDMRQSHVPMGFPRVE